MIQATRKQMQKTSRTNTTVPLRDEQTKKKKQCHILNEVKQYEFLPYLTYCGMMRR